MDTKRLENHADWDFFVEYIVLEVDSVILQDDITLRFSFMSEATMVSVSNLILPSATVPRHRRLHDVIFLHLDNDTVFAHLLLYQDNLLCAIDDEVASRVKRTFMKPSHVHLRLTVEDTIRASKHHRHASNQHFLAADLTVRSPVSNVNQNRGSVSGIPQTTLIGGDGRCPVIAREIGNVLIQTSGFSHADVGEMQVEIGADIAQDGSIRFDDLLQLDFQQVVERIDMLLDETFNLEKSRQKIPFVPFGVDGVCHGFPVVEGLQEGVETIVAGGVSGS